MFSDPVSFSGDTRFEVIAVLANCGRDTDRARRALVTWIRHKQEKGRSTEHILVKLRDVESKFIKDTTLHSAFRDARAETFLPRPPDLPLPSHIKRNSDAGAPESVPPVLTPYSVGHGPISSSIIDIHSGFPRRTGPPISSWRFSRSSSQMSEVFPASPYSGQRTSLPQGVPRVPQPRSPRIQIPRDGAVQPSLSSPITSSPEESEIHLRYRYRSQPMKSFTQSNGLVTPVSASHPEFPLSPVPRDQTRRRLSHAFDPPPSSALIPIPRSRSQRSVPISPPASSSGESDVHPTRCRSASQPIASTSPGLRRVTPPRTGPPDVPLPPIPFDGQGKSSGGGGFSRAEEPPTPVRSLTFQSSTPLRPLPIQPIPSPVPDSDELEPTDIIGENSLRQNWQEPSGDLPSDIVVRQDSPVCAFYHDPAGPTSISPPPAYLDHLDSYFPADMPTIGHLLERAVNECGRAPEVRHVISKCIEFHRGYEPPYWQTRLQACGLDAETTNHLVDEMCKQVDWATSFRRGA